LIEIDTNVLVRLCVRDDRNQVEAALKLLAGAPPGSVRVSVVALAEFAWTLLRRYRLDGGALLGVIENLLNRVELDIEARGAVMTAIQWLPDGHRRFRGLPHRCAQSGGGRHNNLHIR
jgi:predicted nucleic-acid-binding protein